MAWTPSARSAEMAPFLAMEVMERSLLLEREGARVINLGVGEPDFPAPAAAVEACRAALAAGETRYTDSRGLAALREAIAADKSRRSGASIASDQVIVTNGTSAAMLLVFGLLVNPGDEVVIPTPHYPCYPNFVRFCGGTPVFVRSDPAAGWAVDVDAVRRVLTPRTRAIVVASPANPTGAVQSEQTLRALAALGPPLVSDEVYDGLLYDGAVAPSAVALGDQGFVLDGFSKRYAMTGFRLGYAVVPDAAAARALQVMQQNLFISTNHFVQCAGLAALAEGEKTRLAMLEAYARRRRRLGAGLGALGFVVPQLPQGAFYLFVDARAFGTDSLALAFALLEQAHVAVTPGIDFGEAAEGWLRFSFAAHDDAIEEALTRLERVLPGLR